MRGLFKERFSNRRSRSVEPQTNSARDQPTVGITDVERAEGATIVPREQGKQILKEDKPLFMHME